MLKFKKVPPVVLLIWHNLCKLFLVSSYYGDGLYIEGLKPKTILGARLATICVLPLLLAGVLGAPSKEEELVHFLRKLLVEGTKEESHSVNQYTEIVDAVRFFWCVSN